MLFDRQKSVFKKAIERLLSSGKLLSLYLKLGSDLKDRRRENPFSILDRNRKKYRLAGAAGHPRAVDGSKGFHL
jgi:hypothetical protein